MGVCRCYISAGSYWDRIGSRVGIKSVRNLLLQCESKKGDRIAIIPSSQNQNCKEQKVSFFCWYHFWFCHLLLVIGSELGDRNFKCKQKNQSIAWLIPNPFTQDLEWKTWWPSFILNFVTRSDRLLFLLPWYQFMPGQKILLIPILLPLLSLLEPGLRSRDLATGTHLL